MHVTTEDTGLSESTYELVGGTDTESQDGNYTESMSESISSLDFHRPDDVVSLAGTEHTLDDESVADLAESQHIPQENLFMVTSLGTAIAESEPQSDDDAESRSSLEYADNSLQTPSLTPDASAILLDTTPRGSGLRAFWKTNVNLFWKMEDLVEDYVISAASMALPGLIFAALAAAFLPVLYPPTNTTNPVTSSTLPPISRPTTTLLATTASPSTTGVSQPTTGVGLIPLGNADAEDWLFGPRKPAVSFTPQGKQDVLVHVQESVRDTWLTRECLSVTAVRDDVSVQVKFGPVPNGILLQFPRKEAYGVVTVSVKATCRPRTRKQVKVHFGKGIMVEAFEKTKHFAHDISGFVPVAAQEAERRLAGAGRSLNGASQSVSQALNSFSNKLQHGFTPALEKAHRSLHHSLGSLSKPINAKIAHVAEAASQLKENSKEVSQQLYNLKNEAHLALVQSQIKAKMWWLKVSGQTKLYDIYQLKAKSFLAAMEAGHAKLLDNAKTGSFFQGAWSRIVPGSSDEACQQRPGRGMRTHQCNRVA